MAKRFTDTDMWDREWYMALPCRLKCLVKLIRDKADLSGVWSPNWIIASTYIGEPVNEQELLLIDNGNQFKKMQNGKIFCIGFIEFQYGELSEKSPVHRKILSLLKQNDLLDEYKKIGYQYPIDRVQEEDKDKEEEKEEEKESVPIKKYFPNMPTAEHAGDLPDIKINSCIELLKITKQVTVEFTQVQKLWPVFLAQNVNGTKYYANVEAIHSHFINWIKTQKFESATKLTGTTRQNGQALARQRLREQGAALFNAAAREADNRA